MTFLSREQIKDINSRYNKRFEIYGESPKTLGWSSKEQQHIRFLRFIKHYNFSHTNILDIGCGFADFAEFLDGQDIYPRKYTGVDINDHLVKSAQKIKLPFDSEFINCNILDLNGKNDSVLSSYDIVMSVGVFNLDFHGSSNQMELFLFEMLNKMLSLSTSFIAFDFIPSRRIDSYIPEDYIATYNINNIINFMIDMKLAFTIDMSQSPNPMTEAFVIAYPHATL